MEKKTTWEVLSAINCNDKTEKKNGLTYLSWAWAWGIVKENFPSANYEVKMFDGKPYLFDENLGYLIQTEVTIDGETIPMQLPVMDGANKAQKNVPYTYKTKYGEKSVEQATMFDINTAIMRCLTKNLAMFGLGHYIYAGEDLPQDHSKEPNQEPKNELLTEKEISIIKGKIIASTSLEQLTEIHASDVRIKTNKDLMMELSKRKEEILA